MSTPLALVIAAVLVALPCSTSATEAAPARTLSPALSVVQCGHLLDPAAGKLLGATTLIVDAGRIREIHPGSVDVTPFRNAAMAAGGTFRQINLPDATCLPGLIDAHTHLTFETSPTRSKPGAGFTVSACATPRLISMAVVAIIIAVFIIRSLRVGYCAPCVRTWCKRRWRRGAG